MNPTAIAFWLFGAGLGYLVGEVRGEIIGLVVTLGISAILDVFGDNRR